MQVSIIIISFVTNCFYSSSVNDTKSSPCSKNNLVATGSNSHLASLKKTNVTITSLLLSSTDYPANTFDPDQARKIFRRLIWIKTASYGDAISERIF